MRNIIRLFNQNRKLIIIVVGVIAFIIIIIQLLNSIVKENNKNKNTNQIANIRENQEDLPSQSIITGEKVDTEVTKSNVSIIEEFVEKCNNNDIEGAYNMLTDECKEALFPTQGDFESKYYNIIFTSKKVADIDNFRNGIGLYTYRVKIYNNILSTGNASDTSSHQDYMTIDEKSENGKLNVYSFITSKQLGEEVEKDGVIVRVVRKEIYKDNEKYQVEVQNTNKNPIVLDTKESNNRIYIIDSNGTKYYSNVYDMSKVSLEIPANFTKEYTFKFNKIYNTGLTTKSINFIDIVIDYEGYINGTEDVSDRLVINVSL